MFDCGEAGFHNNLQLNLMRCISLLFLLFANQCAHAYESPAEVTIPLLDPISSLNPPVSPTPEQIGYIIFNTASRLAVDLLNNRTCDFPDILPNTKIVLDVRADGASSARALNHFIDFAENGHTLVTGFPLPDTSVPCAIAGKVYGVAQLASFSPPAMLSDKSRFPYFSRAATSTAQQIRLGQDILLHYYDIAGAGWTDIGILSTIDDYNIDYASTFIQLASEEFTIHAYQQFLMEQENIDPELLEVKNSGTRVILALILGDYSAVLEKANEHGLIGDHYVWMCTAARVGLLLGGPNPLARGTISPVNYFPDTSPYSECFFNAWATADPVKYPFAGLGFAPSTLTYFPFDMMMIVATALDQLDKMEMLGEYISPELWSQVIRNSTFPGITGFVSFTDVGDRIGLVSVRYYDPEVNLFLTSDIQREDTLEHVQDVVWFSNTTEIPDLDIREAFDYWSCEDKEMRRDETGKTVEIHTPDRDSQVDDIDSAYYCDSFIDCQNLSDESTDCSTNYLILFIIFGIVTGLLMLIAVVLIIFVFIFGTILKYRRLRTASPTFLILLLISIIIGYSSIFAFFGKPHPVACAFQPWLLGLSSISMIASLSAKNFRIWRLFKYPMKKLKITDFELLLLWLAIMIPAIIILVLWTIVSTPTATMKDRDGRDHYVCATGGFTGEPGGIIFFSIFVGYSALVLLFGAVISILGRNVPSLFNETKLMTVSIYNLGFLSIIIIPVFMAIQPINPFAAWILRSCAVLYAFTATMFLQFASKVIGIFIIDKGSNVKKFRQFKSSTSNGSSPSMTQL